MKRLSDISIGVNGTIQKLERHALEPALNELGLVKGVSVKLIRKDISGSTYYVKYNNQQLAIRRSEAELIWVEE